MSAREAAHVLSDTATDDLDAPLEAWLTRGLEAARIICDTLTLGPLERLDARPPPSHVRAAVVGLQGERRSLDVSLITNASDTSPARRLAAALLQDPSMADLITDEEVDDALGELTNMLVGGMKRALGSDLSGLVMGVPLFVSGSIRRSRSDETLVGRVLFGTSELWLSVTRFPSPPEVQAERRAQRELRVASQFLEEVFRATPDALLVADADGRIEAVNEAAVRLVGSTAEDLQGTQLGRLFEDGAGPAAGSSVEKTCLSSSGERIPVLVSNTTTTAREDGTARRITLLHDLRERRRLELELRQAQKLESVGRLASGVAHEINTPIQYVSDNLNFISDAVSDLAALLATYREALQRLECSDGDLAAVQAAEQQVGLDELLRLLPRAVESSLEGATRVANIVRSMKAFARPDSRERVAVDLNQAVESTVEVARNEYKYVADLRLELGELPPVRCFVGEVNQALLNIVVNAAHAIEDVVKGTNAKGRITVRTRRVDERVLIEVEDTGTGIPDAIQGLVFDPFFTTKEVGRGSGQGLAISRTAIVDKHGGDLRFETTPGVGTRFTIELPL